MSIASIEKVSNGGNVIARTICDNGNMVIKIHDKGRRPAKVYLREWLEYRDMTAERLADRIDASKGTISKLMNGKKRYNQDWLETIAFALNCDVPDLYRPPQAPTANELLAKMSPEAKATAMKVLVDLANFRTGTDR